MARTPEQRPLESKISRRNFLKRTGIGVGALALGDQSFWVDALFDSHGSKIHFDPEQKARLKDATSVCLFFGGLTVGSPEKLSAHLLTSTLASLGPVGFIDYGETGPDIKGIVKRVQGLQERYGISEVDAYFSSSGLQIGSEVFDRLGDTIKLNHGILSSTPVNLSTTRYPWAKTLTDVLDAVHYRGGYFLTWAFNSVPYKNPFKDGAAEPALLWKEGLLLKDGRKSVEKLVRRVEHDGTKLAFITGIDPKSDPTIDPVASERELRAMGLGPYLEENVERLGGNQGHENYDDNLAEYQRVIGDTIKMWKGAVT